MDIINQIHFSTKNKVIKPLKPLKPLNKVLEKINKMFLHQPHSVKEDVKSREALTHEEVVYNGNRLKHGKRYRKIDQFDDPD
jgi:hypothetical protein